MEILDTPFWNLVEGSRQQLHGTSFYESETNSEIRIPPKDVKIYASAYDYCYSTHHLLLSLEEVLREIDLIKLQITKSPEFCDNNSEFDATTVLNFSYKNWIIRIVTFSELLFELTRQVIQCKVSSKENLQDAIFKSEIIRTDKELYLILLGISDLLHEKLLENTKSKSIKRNRNDIVHKGSFAHSKIQGLNGLLLIHLFGLDSTYDATDKVIDENLTSISIENEIDDVTSKFVTMSKNIFSLLEEKYSQSFNQVFTKARRK